MKQILHIQQIGKNEYNAGDLIVRGRDEFSDDVTLARVVGNTGDKAGSKRLFFVSLLDVEQEPAADFGDIMEDLAEWDAAQAEHQSMIGIW